MKRLRKAFAVSSTSIFLWWILFVTIGIFVYGLLLYNGIWTNIPKLVRRDKAWALPSGARFNVKSVITPPLEKVPYYIGDSCIIALPGPKFCMPGRGYAGLMDEIGKLPPLYPGCKLVVMTVSDYRSGMNEAEIGKQSRAIESKLLDLYPESEVVIIPHEEILEAANYSGLDKWHPDTMGFWFLRNRFPEEFPDSLFGQTKSQRMSKLMKPLINKLLSLRPDFL